MPAGPSAVAKDSLASFWSQATDPDGDSVRIRFDWGDGDTSDWSEYVAPGESVSMIHAWSSAGVCLLCAEAKDQRGPTSPWSPVRAVNVMACWCRTFGGTSYDRGHSVQQTSDGGYIIAGETQSYGAGSDDVWLIKTDAEGNKVWDRTFGGADWDAGYSVQQTSDGGYIVAGMTMSYGARPGFSDVWLIKTDVEGNKVWDRTFGGASWDVGRSVQQTSDGGYIIAGQTDPYGAGDYDGWLIKTDADGNEVWDRIFGGDSWDDGRSAQQTSDGGYIIAGETWSPGAGHDDVWLTKTDANGYEVWNKTFDGANCGFDRSAQQTSDDGFIIVGRTDTSGAGCDDAWLVKTDASGNKARDRTFSGEGLEWAYSARQTSDGGYIIAGRTESRDAGSADVWLIRTDAGGSKVWDKTFGGADWDEAHSVQQTADGGYVIVGYTDSYGSGKSDVWLIKTSGP